MRATLGRRAALAALQETPFDVLVVGGGITGVGIARDAAMRGLRVALVERDDIASGTSSRSSRLVHGGVRYLEHGHLGLVFESSRERRTLLRIAPHLVRPLAFTWPVYRGARLARWKLRAGLALYDALALFRNVGTHRSLGTADVLAREPALEPAELRGGATYWDASTDDARLALATALAAREAGATIATHVEAEAMRFGADGARVDLRDTLAGERVVAHARVVVNAAGPWSDDVRRLADERATKGVLGAKGVHVAVPAQRIGNRGAVTLLSPLDGRVMFVLPAGPLTIIGTTETAADASPAAIRASEGDVAYLLASANAFFPAARLGRDDVIAAWAGIRPLAAAHARGGTTRSASREHTIERDARGIITVSGGKLTTYRAMAAEVVDAIGAALGRRLTRSTTDRVPLPGGDADPSTLLPAAAAATGDAEIARRLVAAHGARWGDVWSHTAADPSLARRLVPTLPYVGAEVAHAVCDERARTVADVLVRRVPIAFETRDHGRAIANDVAAIMAPRLGWSADDVAAALRDYEREAARLFAIEP